MSVRKNPNGSWTAVIKQHGRFVGSKTFRSKREADAWEREQKHRLGAGIDLASGRVTVAERLQLWLTDREGSVSEATHIADRDLLRLLPPWFLTLRVNGVTEGHVERLLGEWTRKRAHNSVRRYRAVLSTFFASCLRARLVTSNPVQSVPLPRATKPPVEMSPFSEAELDEVVQAIRARNERLADVVLLLGWSGLRWGELRALRAGDFVHTRSPALRVQRSHSESRSLKGTKSSRSRIVPVADRLVPVLEQLARDKQATELLVTTERGAQLHRTAFIRAADWESLGRGRRIHDLRHTAICLWLLRGVEPLAVKSWAGHQSLATTNQYVHYLGTSADEAGIARLNAPRANLGQISRRAIA